jgi:hypothetical protein
VLKGLLTTLLVLPILPGSTRYIAADIGELLDK